MNKIRKNKKVRIVSMLDVDLYNKLSAISVRFGGISATVRYFLHHAVNEYLTEQAIYKHRRERRGSI